MRAVIDGSSPRGDATRAERIVYGTILTLMTLAYAAAATFHAAAGRARRVDTWFGFSQLRHLPGRGALLLVLVPVAWSVAHKYSGALASSLRSINRALYSRRSLVILTACVAALVFFALRSNYLNPDGHAFEEKFARDVPRVGAHVTHDEMLELYVHSRAWEFANPRFGASVRQVYAVMSAIAGGMFVYVLLEYGREAMPDCALWLAVLCTAGGYMQLFFGDVENYTITSALVMTYLWTSLRFLHGKASVVLATALLATAMTFHLVAGFFLPSLAFLYWTALRRREYAAVATAIVVLVSIVAAVLAFFHYHGLPIADLWTSHALRSTSNPRYWTVSALSGDYLFQLVNLLFLLAPFLVLLIPLIVFRRIAPAVENVFLAIAAGSLLLFCFLWKAQLGIYDDWNLYAVTGIPVGLLVWTNALKIEGIEPTLSVLGIVFALHSYAWILSNHYL